MKKLLNLDDRNRIRIPLEMLMEGVTSYTIRKEEDGSLVLTPVAIVPVSELPKSRK